MSRINIALPPTPRRRASARATLVLSLLAVVLLPASPLVPLVLSDSGEQVPVDQRVELASPELPSPTGSAPVGQAGAVHRAVHTLGSVCAGTPARRDMARARRAVEDIVDFGRQFPNAAVRIHREVGSTLSLLMDARKAAKGCDPALGGQVTGLIPLAFRPARPKAGRN